jgi:SAM-dependent methyltransferase
MTDPNEARGVASGDYFYQDFWAARKVRESGVTEHVDIASRVDGFVAHCALFTKVVYVDIRPIATRIPTIIPKVGDLVALPFPDESVASLSCLSVAEHVGLGRYGDPLDPDGSIKAFKELQRILAPGGQLYLSVPIGRERVCFNAHRIFAPSRVPHMMDQLRMVDFAAVSMAGDLLEQVKPDDFANEVFICGLFHFTRDATHA